MKVLQCTGCGEVMHRVNQPTDQTRQAGIVQLARHNAEQHVIPQLEAMLEVAAQYRNDHGLDIESFRELLRVRCGNPECRKTLTTDSYHYARVGKQTMQCCSRACVIKAKKA